MTPRRRASSATRLRVAAAEAAATSPLVSPFVRRYGPWCVVLGASEGLGAAFALELAARGLNLVLVARREDRLASLAESISATHGVETVPLVLDLAAPDVADHLAKAVRSLDVGLLVYNACAAHIGPFVLSPAASLDAIVAINCASLVKTTRVFAPRLAVRGRGGLLLMSSMAGFHGHALSAAYCASKAFTTALGEGLWAELEPLGIDVRVCAAGATATPNFLAVTPPAVRSLAMPMPPERVANIALSALARRGRGPVVVPGFLNGMCAAVMRRVLTPTAAVRFMSSNLRRIYRREAEQEEELRIANSGTYS